MSHHFSLPTRVFFWTLLRPLYLAWGDLTHGLERLIDYYPEKPLVLLWLKVLSGVLLCWFVYVPLHEFLHVAGCLMSGGDVYELQLSSIYGAEFLKNIFPFIVVSEDYAGRLSRFSTHGSDLVYLSTVLMPFTVTVLCGGILYKLSLKRKSLFMFGICLVIAFAPFISLTGDYLETGSILVTRTIAEFSPFMSGQERDTLYLLRSDDLFRLVLSLFQKPSYFGVQRTGEAIMTFSIVLLAQLIGLVLAGWTYALSYVSGRIVSLELGPSARPRTN